MEVSILQNSNKISEIKIRRELFGTIDKRSIIMGNY